MIKRVALALGVLALLCTPVHAGIHSISIGTGVPPTSGLGYTLTPCDESAQSAISDFTSVSTIPCDGTYGDITVSPNLDKRTVPASWSTWSHGYTGPVFFNTSTTDPATFRYPDGTIALYLYVEPNNFSVFDVEVGAKGPSGLTSRIISVDGSSGATGVGFYTDPGETIRYVRVIADPAASGFAVGEFGFSSTATVPAMPSPALILLALAILAFGALLARRTIRRQASA